MSSSILQLPSKMRAYDYAADFLFDISNYAHNPRREGYHTTKKVHKDQKVMMELLLITRG